MNAPFDMASTIIAKSDQLNSDDLISGPRTITIRKVSAGETEQPVNVYYEGDDNKPFRPCKTVRRVMVALWGRDAQAYVGRSMRLYRDPEVAFGGMKVGGIRVSHMSHIDGEQTVVVMKTKGKKAPMKIVPLPQQAARSTPGNVAANAAGGRDRAAEFAEQTLAAIASAPDRDALVALQVERGASLARLERERSQLHDKIAAAIRTRNEAFDAGSDDDGYGADESAAQTDAADAGDDGAWRTNPLTAG